MTRDYIQERIEELERAYKYGLENIYDGNLTPERIKGKEQHIARVMTELYAIRTEIKDLQHMLFTIEMIERIENKK